MSYTIADEPTSSEQWGHVVYSPSAPLLATMICGAWLAWPWFIINGLAMGSATVRREIQLCLVALVGSALFGAVLYALVDAGVIESRIALQLGLLAITSWKLGLAYAISTVQSRSYDVYAYSGGSAQNALYVILVGSSLRDLVLSVSQHPVWRVVMS